MSGVVINVDFKVAQDDPPPAELSIVRFLDWWRVMDAHRIVAVCETRDEAVAYVSRQATRKGSTPE